MSTLTATPLPDAPFGAVITLPEGVTDPSQLSTVDFDALLAAVQTHLVVVIPGQQGLLPQSQYELTKRFDPSIAVGNYGHEEKIFLHKDSVLSKDGKLVPGRPEVVRVGNGVWTPEELEEIEGFPSQLPVDLEHPMQHTFHHKTLTEDEIAAKQTRFFRWHIDAALYKLNPPLVTTLLGLHVPETTQKQQIKYEDSDAVKEVVQGATAFASGAIAYKLLSDADKEFVNTHSVVYAPHPYIFIGACKATSDGLTLVSEGKERELANLPEWSEAEMKTFPLVWTNPTTKQPHVQVHACCVYKIINSKTGAVVAEMEDARKLCRGFLRPAIQPENVYAHPWQSGDLCIFFNRGVTHSVTSQFAHNEKRLMHQCNIASGVAPTNESQSA